MGETAMTLAVCPMRNALLLRTHAVIINVMARIVAVILLVKGDPVAPAPPIRLHRHPQRLLFLQHHSILQVIIIIIIRLIIRLLIAFLIIFIYYNYNYNSHYHYHYH